jgi:hypothetical protein
MLSQSTPPAAAGSRHRAGQNMTGAPTATRTRDLPLRRSPVAVEIYAASRINSPLCLRILLPVLTMLPQRPCRLMPENAALSVGFLWGPPPGSLTHGESVGRTECLFGALDEGAAPVAVGPGAPSGTVVGRRFGSQACRTLSTLRPPTPHRLIELTNGTVCHHQNPRRSLNRIG